MANLDMTAMNAGLKELYTDQVVQSLVYEDRPLIALLPKNEDFGGKVKPIPIIIGASQGRSAVFATAQANQTAPVLDSFLLTSVSDYALGTIDNKTMLASATDKMAFLTAAKVNIDGAFTSITNSFSSASYRSGTGTIGQVSSGGPSSGVITLTDAETVTQFEVNQTLRVSATDGGAVRSAKGYVIAVDRSAGTVTVASSGIGGIAANPASWAANDYISVDGDLNAKVSGLSAWCPASAPSSTAFYGVDRSVDTRLGGLRYDGSALSVEEALTNAAMLGSREGARFKWAMVTFTTYGALENSLGSKVQYQTLKGPGEIMFEGIKLNGPKGPITVIPDKDALPKTSFLIDPRSWAIEGLGKVPQILTYGAEGLSMLRVSNQDAAEVRVGYYANISNNSPGWNMNVKLGV